MAATLFLLAVVLARWDGRTGLTCLLRFGDQFAAQRIPELERLPLRTYRGIGYDGQFYAQLFSKEGFFNAGGVELPGFRELLAAGGEVGKKLDFLLQEMNREANTLLSKTGGVGGKGTRITELGLAMKAEIEKTREQIQNVE